MTRVEVLTIAWLDGSATPSQREELESLVDRDDEARRFHLSLVELEAALRARRPRDVTAEVLDRIHGNRSAGTAAPHTPPPPGKAGP